MKLLVAASAVDEAAFDKLAAASPAAEDLTALTKPGPTIWGTPLVTVGEVSKIPLRSLSTRSLSRSRIRSRR